MPLFYSYELENISVIGSKRNSRIIVDNKVIKISLNNVYFPFGLEQYNKKNILNINLGNYKNSNYVYNSYSYFTILNEFMRESIKEHCDLEGLDYMPIMKIYEYQPTIRTYYPDNCIISNNNDPLITKNLKGKRANIELEIPTLWKSKNSYGLIAYVKKIELI